MTSSPSSVADVPPALAAFLRGVERRGALFGELQCGDSDAGDTALAAAMRAFRNQAAGQPMAEWPHRFWALLAATPQLRGAVPGAVWPPGTQVLAAAEPLPRQALLLRLAAGLDEEAAASVLNLTVADYRQALAIACPRDAQGQPDASAWRALAETIQLHLRELPPQRLVRLAELRETALKGGRLHPGPGAKGRPGPATRIAKRPSRKRIWWALALLLVGAVAAVAVWWWPHWRTLDGAAVEGVSHSSRVPAEDRITRDTLPLESPAARFDEAFALDQHPDAALLLDPEAQTVAQDADFYAWYAAGREAVSKEESMTRTQSLDPATVAETSDAQL